MQWRKQALARGLRAVRTFAVERAQKKELAAIAVHRMERHEEHFALRRLYEHAQSRLCSRAAIAHWRGSSKVFALCRIRAYAAARAEARHRRQTLLSLSLALWKGRATGAALRAWSALTVRRRELRRLVEIMSDRRGMGTKRRAMRSLALWMARRKATRSLQGRHDRALAGRVLDALASHALRARSMRRVFRVCLSLVAQEVGVPTPRTHTHPGCQIAGHDPREGISVALSRPSRPTLLLVVPPLRRH